MRVTKIQPPPIGANFVARPRLEDLAAGIAAVPVTLVRAGGGFGKTTLLRAWADRLPPDLSVAWLSLEQHDASSAGIVEALNESFRRALNGFGNSAGQLLEQGVEHFPRLVSALANELIAWIEEHERGVAVFVDDVQFVVEEKSALDALGEFLRSLPERVHIVLASRAPLKFAPLSKMRASGAVREIEELDLRFNIEEATKLLLDEEAATIFVEQTEGWAIALGLTAQVVRANPDGWQQAMLGSRQSIFDFLAEEVIERLPDPKREQLFILAVPAIIDDVYAAALLQDVSYESVISEMIERGLYVSRVGERAWRLHHLFRDFLLERFRRIDSVKLKAFQIRYAALLRQNGLKMDALGVLLDADDYRQIVDYVLEALQTIRITDRYKAFIRLLSRVPEHVMKQYPMLHRFYGTALVRDGRIEQAREQLSLCYERAMESGDLGTACAAQMELGILSDQFYYLRHGVFTQSEEHFVQGVELAQRPELAGRPVAREVLQWHLGMALACRSAFSDALGHLAIAEEIERAASQHVDNVLVEIAIVHGWMGNWRRSLEYAELAEELFRGGGGEVQIGRALMAQGQAHLALHPTSDRCTEVARAAVVALEADQPEELAGALVLFARVLLNHSPPSIQAANSALERAGQRLENFPNPVVGFDLAAARFECALLSGQMQSAQEQMTRARTLAQALNDPWQIAMSAFMGGLLALINGQDEVAKTHFVRASTAFESVGDRYHQALADLSAGGCDARGGTASASEIRRLFEFIKEERLEYVFAAAPRSSASMLAWCIRNDGVLSEDAELLIVPALRNLNSEIAEIARNSDLPGASRAAAIRVIAKSAPAQALGIVRALCSDGDPLVAGTARATLDYLPSPLIPRLRVCVIGELQLGGDGNVITEKDDRWGRKRASELLRFLAVSKTTVTKSAVMSALWPESESVADTTLRVTLHLLRRALQPGIDGSGDYVAYDGSVMRLNADAFDPTDADEAEAALRQADLSFARSQIDAARSAFNQAVQIYANSPREDDVTDWLRPHVRKWREQCVRALHGLAKLERAAGDVETALRVAQQALSFDPLNELTILLLLDCYAVVGELDAGKRVFAAYKRRLLDQIGSTPGPAVLESYTRILGRRGSPGSDGLSAREREVLALVSRGLSNKQIGAELGLSTWTINNHVAKILKKLNVESRTAAAATLAGA